MTVWFDHFILVKLCNGTCILVNVLGNPTNSTRMAWAKLAAWCAGECLEASRHDQKIWKRSVFAARSDIFVRTTNGSHAMNKLELASFQAVESWHGFVGWCSLSLTRPELWTPFGFPATHQKSWSQTAYNKASVTQILQERPYKGLQSYA